MIVVACALSTGCSASTDEPFAYRADIYIGAGAELTGPDLTQEDEHFVVTRTFDDYGAAQRVEFALTLHVAGRVIDDVIRPGVCATQCATCARPTDAETVQFFLTGGDVPFQHELGCFECVSGAESVRACP